MHQTGAASVFSRTVSTAMRAAHALRAHWKESNCFILSFTIAVPKRDQRGSGFCAFGSDATVDRGAAQFSGCGGMNSFVS